MRKGTLVIIGLVVLIAAAALSILVPYFTASGTGEDGSKIPLAANEINIRQAVSAFGWEANKHNAVYYYYVNGDPDRGTEMVRPSNIVMTADDVKTAIEKVQNSLKGGIYTIIAVTDDGEELKTCPYVSSGTVWAASFGVNK